MSHSPPLIATKLFVPAPRADAVPRPRLIERLEMGLGCRLTLLSAPAGFGKTSLLSLWAAVRGWRVAWLSLDEADDDPARFLAYLAAALQTAAPDIGLSAAALLASPRPPPYQAVLTALINDLCDLGTPKPDAAIVLVLDDYHLLSAEPIHDAVTFLVEHLPPNLRLIIATRADPPLPLARWRAKGQLAEIHAADLRFTADEAADFLNRTARLDLAESDVEALAARTEGWIAALQLAAAAMRGKGDPADFVQSFTGSNRYILDYLGEEVLQRQPPELQDFLLETSILDRLTGPLCDAVIGKGQPPAAVILEQFERANLLVMPLDDRREWYRYHRLFADLLQHRLRQWQPDLVPELHRRASAWYEAQGDIAQAIDHALRAGEAERAAELVDRAADEVVKRGGLMTVLRWLERLGRAARSTRPRLNFYYVVLLLLAGRPAAEVDAVMQAAETASAGQFAGELDACRALLAAFRGEAQPAIDLSRRALERLPEAHFLHGMARRTLGTLYLLTGEFAAAERLLEEDVTVAERAGDLVGASASLRRLGTMHLLRGRLRAASAMFRRATEVGADEMGRPLPVAGRAWIRLGDILREWNKLDEAVRTLQEGIALVEDWAPTWGMNGYLSLARIRQTQGDADGARRDMETARRLAAEFDVTEMDDIAVLAQQARLWIAQGDLEAAARWAEERGAAPPGMPSPRPVGELYAAMIQEMEHLTLARLHLAQGRAGEALGLLDPMLLEAETTGRAYAAIEISALQALAHWSQNNEPAATAALERALSQAEPEGYVRSFLDEGGAMRDMLAGFVAQAAGRTPADPRLLAYARKLLSEFECDEALGRQAGEAEAQPAAVGLQPLLEPLSERELDVLRLLDLGLSTPEAAERLTVAVSTVRSHVKNIYGKLGVHRRLDALRRAEELGLLS